MIRIESIDDTPLAEVWYQGAQTGGGSMTERLPIVRAHATGLPAQCNAIVTCGDLQGIVNDQLLGLAVAEQLDELARAGVIPALARSGAILTGDLYSVPAADQRGGFGDVAPVWRAFADRFAWVAGVAGNHDDVSDVDGENVHLLDGNRVVLDGIRIGGVGNVIGSRPKPGRRTGAEQLTLIAHAIGKGVDIIVLHEGPHGGDNQRGLPAINAAVDGVELAIFGHDHWDEPLAHTTSGQLLNVDARVVVVIPRA